MVNDRNNSLPFFAVERTQMALVQFHVPSVRYAEQLPEDGPELVRFKEEHDFQFTHAPDPTPFDPLVDWRYRRFAVCIQRAWRAYFARLRVDERRTDKSRQREMKRTEYFAKELKELLYFIAWNRSSCEDAAWKIQRWYRRFFASRHAGVN
jgi:hypothetical protein